MKKKKLLIIIVVLLMLITSFFVLTKKPKIKYKKLKELNYNVTYKQAFPDENLRRSVVLCIMRDICNFAYFGTIYSVRDTSTYQTDTKFGPVITEEEIESKSKEKISKQALDKLAVIVPNDINKKITTLQGIEYLSNLLELNLSEIEQENLDFSYNKKLKYLFIKGSKIKTINLNENLELIYLSAVLSEDEKILDLSHLNNLKNLSITNSGLTSVKLPNGVELVNLNQNLISNINIPNTVIQLEMNENKLSHIDLPEGMKYVELKYNRLKTINVSSTVYKIDLYQNLLTSIILPANMEYAYIQNNQLKNITLKGSVKKLELENNRLTNIDLQEGIEELNLFDNPLEDIDLRNNSKLVSLKLTLKSPKDTIDFSNNPKLNIVKIYGEDGGKIKSLDFTNQPNLKKLQLENLGLTNLNIEKNIELRELVLKNNNLNKIDLSNLKNIEYLILLNNNSQNIKYYKRGMTSVLEYRQIKVKKNSYVTIPRMFYNDKEYFLEDKPYYYYKIGNKYVFKQFNNDVIQAGDIWIYTIEVEAGEEDSFNPSINQGNYTPLINEEIPVNNLKEMITNLPANIKNFEVLSPNSFTEKGDKTIKVRITFSDDTFKEIDIPIKVYEKEDILPTVTVTPETLEVIDKKPVNINITRSYAKEDNVDNTNFIKTVRDNLVSYEYLNKANGLTYNSNSVTGVIDYLFTGTEEEHTFNITYKEKGNIYTFNKNISIKLLRDTDKDGVPDKDDDDKDGDGYSNAVEIARGSDPYNKDSLPDMSKKDELDNLVKQLEKLIEDTKNNSFDNKNKIDVDNLKNNFLPGKVTEKDNIKGSYSATTSDSDLLKLINKVKSEIDDIKKEINKLRDKANFDELDKEITKEIKDIYTKESVKVLQEKILEAKSLNRDTATQQEVDKLTKEIKDLREKLIIRIEEPEEKENIINPNTGIKTYSLIILLIIFVSYLVFKKKKKVYFKN